MRLALCFTNAVVWDGHTLTPRDRLYIGAHNQDALTIDLSDYAVLPAWLNAHDHLELNHYPRTKFRDIYPNAHQWGEDVNARLNDDPYHTLRHYPLWDRLFIGGLKNLLCGAIKVIHHGPHYRELFHPDFPVRVCRQYGWAHSLHFDSDEAVRDSYCKTPHNWPWFIHLAEGTDKVAAEEYKRLRHLGCVGKNTVLVHAVGMAPEDIQEAIALGVHFVLCPTSNRYLLGQAVTNLDYFDDCFLIGSDSRLTADGDLLDELSFLSRFHSLTKLFPKIMPSYASNNPPYADGDIIVLKSEMVQSARDIRRADIALILRGGIPQIGDPDMMARFPYIETLSARLDGIEKAIHVELARRIIRCRLKEPRLEILEEPTKKRKLFWFF